MPLAPGTHIGPYEIISSLGAGGMGEVYRARDTRLKRDVALKVLPDAFAQDADRLARFQREAELLATLNHPNIAAVYGLEESGGLTAIVLELVDGTTLAGRLTARPVPIDEALAIARQIADALQAAHARGVLHRDLKPGNIALASDGQVKVLDFGLAKAIAPDSSSNVANSPTERVAETMTGVMMGTAGYMSPEQAQGLGADKRSDVWAFGCVLFEMLSGRRAFRGDTVSETIAAILRDEPDWTALPPSVPEWLRSLLTQCLAKDRRARVADISIVAYILNERMASSGRSRPVARDRPARSWRVAAVCLALVVLALAAALVWQRRREVPPAAAAVTRSFITPPAERPFLNSGGSDPDLSVSPDGSRIVYVSAANPSEVVVRAVNALDGLTLRGLGRTEDRFISPDGQWLGFVDEHGLELRKVPMAGGTPVTICCLDKRSFNSAAWLDANTIVFAQYRGGLWRVPAAGGDPQRLAGTDKELDAKALAVLPEGRGVLYTTPTTGDFRKTDVGVLDLRTGTSNTLIHGGSNAQYVATGHLVFVVPGALRAVRFDLDRLEVKGQPVTVVDQLVTTTSGGANYGISRQGTLVYVPGGVLGGHRDNDRTLVWVNRKGEEEPLAEQPRPRAYSNPRLSPDRSRVALQVRDTAGKDSIWVYDFRRNALTPLTLGATGDSRAAGPVWTRDGRRIAFWSNRDATRGLFWQAADGSDSAERLTTSPGRHAEWPVSFTPDGRELVFGSVATANNASGAPTFQHAIEALTLAGERRSRPLVQVTGSGPWVSAALSPDGRWLAYESEESRYSEVYVRPFPDVNRARWQVSTGGGMALEPVWSPTGRELFYRKEDGRLMAVPIRVTPAFAAGPPVALFNMTGKYSAFFYARAYDVSLDGQRFLMFAEERLAGLSKPASFVVVQNWFEELKTRVPK